MPLATVWRAVMGFVRGELACRWHNPPPPSDPMAPQRAAGDDRDSHDRDRCGCRHGRGEYCQDTAPGAVIALSRWSQGLHHRRYRRPSVTAGRRAVRM